MANFKFEFFDASGDVMFSFVDREIIAFRLNESLSGIRPTFMNDREIAGIVGSSHEQTGDMGMMSASFSNGGEPGSSQSIPRDYTVTPALEPPYSLRIRLAARDIEKKMGELIGLTVKLTIDGEGSKPRFLHGTTFKAVMLGGARSQDAALDLHICPWLWYLAFNRKNRIMSGTCLDVFNNIISEYPDNMISAPTVDTSQISSQLASHDFIIQYRESDYSFISRIMEEAGLFFYFVHEENSQKLVFGEKNADFLGDVLDVDPIKLASHQLVGSELFDDYVTNLNLQQQVVPQQYRARDYNADNASASLDAKSPSADSVLEVFDYPGGFEELADGLDNVSPRRARMLKSFQTLCTGRGKNPLFMPGLKVKMPESSGPVYEPMSAELKDKTYVIRQTMHSWERDENGLGRYWNFFDMMLFDNEFSPAPITPRTTIKSPMTAIVTTQTSGETIDVDDQFRPLIRFKWDSNNTGVRARLAQGWAGSDHGMQILPRVTDEVLISFLDGDIDRPVIIGSLYNSASKALFNPTENEEISAVTETEGQFRYVSGIHDAGGNQILLYDKWGEERMIQVATGSRDDMTAERHLTAATDRVDVTKNDKVEDVLNDYTLYIGGNLKIDVVGDIRFKVGGTVLRHHASSSDDIKRK